MLSGTRVVTSVLVALANLWIATGGYLNSSPRVPPEVDGGGCRRRQLCTCNAQVSLIRGRPAGKVEVGCRADVPVARQLGHLAKVAVLPSQVRPERPRAALEPLCRILQPGCTAVNP